MKKHKTLIHLHTDYSFDCNISPESLVRFAVDNGFGCLGVTDHDTVEGAFRVKELAKGTGVRVIVGEEVSTRDGHLIGLFLNHNIDPGMSARDTALAIRAQGGLVLAPHPFVKFGGCGLREAVWDIVDLIDAVEVNNAQNLLSAPDREADDFACRLGLARYVGADSHLSSSIAPCYQQVADFSGRDDFVDAVKEADLIPGRHPLWYFASAAYRMARHQLGMALPNGYGANYRPHPSGFPVALGPAATNASASQAYAAA